jgi:hypothetical protein
MARAAAKVVDGVLKEPFFFFFGVGVPTGGLIIVISLLGNMP